MQPDAIMINDGNMSSARNATGGHLEKCKNTVEAALPNIADVIRKAFEAQDIENHKCVKLQRTEVPDRRDAAA